MKLWNRLIDYLAAKLPWLFRAKLEREAKARRDEEWFKGENLYTAARQLIQDSEPWQELSDEARQGWIESAKIGPACRAAVTPQEFNRLYPSFLESLGIQNGRQVQIASIEESVESAKAEISKALKKKKETHWIEWVNSYINGLDQRLKDPCPNANPNGAVYSPPKNYWTCHTYS